MKELVSGIGIDGDYLTFTDSKGRILQSFFFSLK
jgi:hypothetical protein